MNEIPSTPPIIPKRRPWKLIGCLSLVGLFVVVLGVGTCWEKFTDSGRRYTADQDARALQDSLAAIERAAEKEQAEIREATEKERAEAADVAEKERAEAAERAEKDQAEQERDRKRLGSEAKVTCERFVKDRLVSPASADFPWLDYTANCIENRCTISSYVDSENRFGASLRTTFRCLVEESSKNQWTLIELETS